MISKKVLIEFFKISPTPSLVLLPNAPMFTIAEVKDSYLETTNTCRAVLLGKGIFEAYKNCANCYVTKPIDVDESMEAAAKMENFWITIVIDPKRITYA